MRNSFTILVLSLLAVACFSSITDENGLQVTVFDEYREATIGVPLYFTFELKNVGKEEIIIPLERGRDFNVVVKDKTGETKRHGGLTMTWGPGAQPTIKLLPGETHFHSTHLNGVFGWFSQEGNYTVQLIIESNGFCDMGQFINGKYFTEMKPCWKGRIETPEVKLRVLPPPTEEDRKAYKLVSTNGPIPSPKNYLPHREDLFERYPLTIYAGLAIIDGFFLKTEKYPDKVELAKQISMKYADDPISILLTYYTANFCKDVTPDNKISGFKQIAAKYSGTGWAIKARRAIKTVNSLSHPKNEPQIESNKRNEQ